MNHNAVRNSVHALGRCLSGKGKLFSPLSGKYDIPLCTKADVGHSTHVVLYSEFSNTTICSVPRIATLKPWPANGKERVPDAACIKTVGHVFERKCQPIVTYSF